MTGEGHFKGRDEETSIGLVVVSENLLSLVEFLHRFEECAEFLRIVNVRSGIA